MTSFLQRCRFWTLVVFTMASALNVFGADPEKPADAKTHGTPLIKLPVNFGPTAECTPVVFNARPLIVSNFHDDTLTDIDQRVKTMYLYIQDVNTGRQIAKFGEGHCFVSAIVDGTTLHVFASEERKKDIYRFSSNDLKTWERDVAIPVDGNEHLFNTSVCADDQGYLMAYESDNPTHYCFKFARSNDLKTWKKIDGLVFAGVDGKQYSACPVIRFCEPYYYVIYLHEAIPGHNGDEFRGRCTQLLSCFTPFFCALNEL